MASPAAIMRAAKAVPGGARPTPAPQGSGPYFGQISPLAAQLANEHGYASAYGPFLPRPSRTFTEGAFGPFSPILPVPVDAPPPGAELADPRRFEYPVGYNLPSIPGQDGFKLASFGTLASLANTYSIARTCIERRKYDIAGLDWDVVPTKEASKAYSTSHSAMKDFGERRAAAIKFLRQPDPNYFSFQSFMKAALEEIFVFDALSVLMKPKRGRGLGKGILGSDLDCFNLVDGPTIKPLLALHAGMPRPPAPAYQQYLYGVPRSDIMSMVDERDILEAGLEGYQLGKFTTDQLLYLPTTPRPFTPYGFSAVEMALIVIMTGLRKQAFQLQYYDEGTVPSVYISPGDVNITPNQIRELQDSLNAVANDQAWHHKVIVLPPDAKVMPQRAQELADQFDEIIMSEVAMVFDVDPMSLGIVPKVSTSVSPFAARELAQASRTVHDRTSTKPLLKYWCDIFNTVLHKTCGQDDMRFTFAGMDEAQDQAAMTDLLVKQVQSGLISIDEAREELQRTAWGLDETSGPLVFTQMGPVPLNQVIEMMQQMQPMQTGQNAAANSGNSVTASHQPRAVHHPPSSRPVGSHNPRQGLPSGGGMRTGLPASGGSASDTPAHAAARAHQQAGKTPAKAVRAELDALARHLRKGRDIATWMPRYLSGVVMATVSEDLTKGIGIDEAVRGAVQIALPREAYEWADDVFKASSPQWPGWQKQQQLQQQYQQQVRAAFTQAAAQAQALIAQWLSGALAVTAMALARMILAIFAAALLVVLKGLWAEAWHMGRQAAHAVLAEAEVDWGEWEPGSPSDATDLDGLEEWIASHGRQGMEWIEDTAAEDLAAYLDNAARGGQDADAIADGIPVVLDADGRSDLISETEMERAQGAASEQVFRQAGVALKAWITENDSKVCFPAGTPVATPDGDVPIERLRPGDFVLTPQGKRRVRRTMVRPYRGGLTTIQAENRTVTATDNHLFMTVAGWRRARELKPGDLLKSLDNQIAKIDGIIHLAFGQPDDVPAKLPKRSIAGSVPSAGTLMPVLPVGLDRDAKIGQREIDRPLPYVKLRDELDVKEGECLPDAELQQSLARELAVAASGAKSRVRVPVGLDPELGPAVAACREDGWPAAFFGAESPVEVLLGAEPLAAPLAVDVLGADAGACQGARPVPVSGACRHLEVVAADRAGLGDPPRGEVALPGAVSPLRILALLRGVEDHPAASAFPGLVDDGRPVVAVRGAEGPLGFQALGTHEDFTALAACVRKGHLNESLTIGINDDESLLVYDITVDTEHVFYAADFLVHNCGKCRANQAQGGIPFNAAFSDGSYWTPGHPACRCQAIGAPPAPAQKFDRGRSVELNGQEYWPAGSYPHGPAAGGGGPVHAAHDATGNNGGTQQYIPGGVPGMTAGGEPPRWGGAGAPARAVSASPRAENAGRGDTQTRGGGTVGGPYRDRSDETHASGPHDDADDADWPEHRGVPPRPGRDWPAPYMDGYWPSGGHGTGQSPVMSIGATDRGRPPNAHGKSATAGTSVSADTVHAAMRENFPDSAIGWVKRTSWSRREIPWDLIDDDDIHSWAASHEPEAVDRFARQIQAGEHVNPSIVIRRPGASRYELVDGHHKALARRKLGQPVHAYAGDVRAEDVQAAEETHSSQMHSGSDPANKAAESPVAAGIAVRAADTGRILMLQRAFDDDDPAAGFWEFPGGRLEDGEDAFEAARREWSEETGIDLPEGDLSGLWNAGNGKYRGFVLTIQSEDAVDILGPRDDVDNPDGDFVEAIAWWDPGQLKDNPAVRPELSGDLKRVRRALKSAETPIVSTVHHPLGHEGLWHTPDRHVSTVQQLPAYFQNTARALMRDHGMGEQQAIATAVNAVRAWAAGHAFGGKVKVTPEVQAAAQRAMNEWEELRASHAG